MSDNHETVADIVAAMRKYRDVVIVQNKFADRIEAAHAREVEDAERRGNHAATEAICETLEKVGPPYDAEAVGNAAKLREALIKCYQLAYEWEANEREGIVGVEPGAKDSTETLFDIQQITTAALDAPPRNCDRFGSCVEARAEWWKYEVLPRVEGVVGGTEPPFEEWLFAPATEQKGENDGK